MCQLGSIFVHSIMINLNCPHDGYTFFSSTCHGLDMHLSLFDRNLFESDHAGRCMKSNQFFDTSLKQKSIAQKRFKLDSARSGANRIGKCYDQLNISSDLGSNDFEEAKFTNLRGTDDKSFRQRPWTSNLCRIFLHLYEKLVEAECITVTRLLDTNFSVLK